MNEEGIKKGTASTPKCTDFERTDYYGMIKGMTALFAYKEEGPSIVHSLDFGVFPSPLIAHIAVAIMPAKHMHYANIPRPRKWQQILGLPRESPVIFSAFLNLPIIISFHNHILMTTTFI